MKQGDWLINWKAYMTGWSERGQIIYKSSQCAGDVLGDIERRIRAVNKIPESASMYIEHMQCLE